MTSAPALSPADRAALAALVSDVQGIFGVRLVLCAAYGLTRRGDGGPLHVLVLVERLTFEDLEACARRMPAWQHQGIAAPLLLERAEFERTLDVFPLEYGAILGDYAVLAGSDMLAGLRVADGDVRRAVEFHAKSLLIHLREGFLETGGDARAVHALVAASGPAFHALLANIARLAGETSADLPAMAERQMGIPASTVREVLAAGGREPSAAEDFTPLLMRYLDAARGIWAYVDGWRAP